MLSTFNQDLSTWNVRNVVNMTSMFHDASSFNQDIGNWDVSSVTQMVQLFRNAVAFNQDISGWPVGNSVNMSLMFYNSLSFNQDIGSWDVSSVSSMKDMFRRASAFDQDLSNWDISSIIDIRDMLSFSAMSSNNYEMTMSGWSTLAAGEVMIPQNLILGAIGLSYCDDTYRNELINTFGWTITDAGQDCVMSMTASRTDSQVNQTDEVENLLTAITLNTYPNPASDILRIEGSDPINTIALYDLYGKKVVGRDTEKNSSVELNTTSFPSGIYLLRVYIRDGMIEKKVIIKH